MTQVAVWRPWFGYLDVVWVAMGPTTLLEPRSTLRHRARTEGTLQLTGFQGCWSLVHGVVALAGSESPSGCYGRGMPAGT